MFNKTLFFFVLLFFLCNSSYPQHIRDNSWMIPFPKNPNQLPISLQNQTYPLSWNSRAFAYKISGGTLPVGPVKFFLNAPGVLTSLATDPNGTNYIQAGTFDGSGTWYGVRYATNALVKIDTSTGVMIQIATVTGGYLTGLAWDFTTNTMYASSYNAGTNTIGTLNLATGVFTPLAGTSNTGILIDMACSNNGSLYGHVITSQTTESQIYRINGGSNWTLIGNTGFIAANSQGMSYDHLTDSCYLAAFNYTTNTGELRKVNVLTGATTLIGSFGCQLDGFAILGNPGPEISNVQILNNNTCATPFIVNCNIKSVGSAINPYFTKFFWSRNSPSITDSVQFTNTGGNNWSCTFPNVNPPATYRYYLRTADSMGRFCFLPPGAPTNLYMFINNYTDTSKPFITHSPLHNFPKCYWPAKIKCQATEPCNIDSVWISWKKNNTGAYYRFNLVHDSATYWSGVFNSDSNFVTLLDRIYYRIVARSASSQHTKDSTALYNFGIICALGNDTLQSNYPFTTYWMDGRTDILFTASELSRSGIPVGYPFITQIAFNVINADPIAMNGFNIKMQNTTMTTLTAFVNSGWSTCYSGTYTVPGTGWQYINLTSFFNWNGTSNLLVEICYNNSSYTNYSKVYASPMTGKAVGYYTDLPTGDGCYAAWTATQLSYRPNVTFCGTIDEIKNVGSNIPDKYSLSQNYPNPFNPNTKIDYAIPKNGFVSLKIYDILGREVKTLVNENITTGFYSIDFNGSEFSSGVYFYRLESIGFSDVKKMILIK